MHVEWTLFKAIESVKMGLKLVKKIFFGEKIGLRLGKKIDRLEVYTPLPWTWALKLGPS